MEKLMNKTRNLITILCLIGVVLGIALVFITKDKSIIPAIAVNIIIIIGNSIINIKRKASSI